MPRHTGRGTSRTTLRDRHRKIIRADEPPCHICGKPIDYEAPRYHPDAFVIDHVHPLARGGTDTLDNLAAAHWSCNRDKSARLPEELHTTRALPTGVTFITHRDWWSQTTP